MQKGKLDDEVHASSMHFPSGNVQRENISTNIWHCLKYNAYQNMVFTSSKMYGAISTFYKSGK